MINSRAYSTKRWTVAQEETLDVYIGGSLRREEALVGISLFRHLYNDVIHVIMQLRR